TDVANPGKVPPRNWMNLRPLGNVLQIVDLLGPCSVSFLRVSARAMGYRSSDFRGTGGAL
ncbi:MAG TPA: hypothetical protein PKI05_13715, partial [Thermogutta sp.]|nr:hypothetical protein [Thermogutta sp.]